MFGLLKYGINLAPGFFGTLDPLVIELIREERLRAAGDRHADELAQARKYAAQDEDDVKKAA